MNLSKLRIMQQIQIALVEKGLSADVGYDSSCHLASMNVFCFAGRGEQLTEMIWDDEVTESELQLWHDTIVYGPQVTVKEGE